MLTLEAEFAKLSADIPLQGVAEAIWTPGGLLHALPFAQGNGTLNHTWNRESSLPSIGPVPLGGAVPQTNLTLLQKTVAYKWFGADLLFDRRSVAINSNIQDAKAVLVEQAAKAMRRQIEEYLITGDNSSDSNQFDGLNLLFPGTVKASQHAQVKGANNDATNGDALTWDDIYDAWDTRVHDEAKMTGFWTCGSFVMNKIRTLVRTAAGGALPGHVTSESFGGTFPELMDRPIVLNNYFDNTETRGDSVDTRSLWYVGLGEDGLHGRLPLGGNEAIVVEDFGRVHGFSQDVLRVMFGMTLVVGSDLHVARIAGINA